ncbi:hypothetical protein HDU67_006309 [Dinochytrium kinnereticum]|nr:hypothetical protein HDU67_006309 [Dinochytrium kinnereticum]
MEDITSSTAFAASGSSSASPTAYIAYTPILQQLSDPEFIFPLLACLALQPVVYFGLIALFPKQFASPKQRGWILTALSSFVMTVASVPYIADYVMHPGSLNSAPCMGWTATAKIINAFFVSYCLGDLIMGTLFYPSEMNPWSGYFHHTLYTFMVTNLVQRGLASAFVIFGVLEAPTLLMAMGSIHKPLRNDKLFGAVFFVTRLLFHVYMTLHIAFLAYPWTLTFMYPGCVLPLHVMWFNGWVKQQQRIKAKAATTQSSTKAASAPAPTSTSTLPTRPSATSLITRTEAYRKAMALKERFLTPRHKRPQRHGASMDASPLLERRSSLSGAPVHLKAGHGIHVASVVGGGSGPGREFDSEVSGEALAALKAVGGTGVTVMA